MIGLYTMVRLKPSAGVYAGRVGAVTHIGDGEFAGEVVVTLALLKGEHTTKTVLVPIDALELTAEEALATQLRDAREQLQRLCSSEGQPA